MADLSPGSEAREHVAKKNFVMPGKHPKGDSGTKGKYPIPDKAHARAAEGFCAMHHGSGSSECQAVRAKVHAKFGADNSSLEQHTVEAMLATSEVLNKAAAAYNAKEAQDKAVAAEIPGCADAVVMATLVDTEEKQALAGALTDHKQCLALLKFAAEAYTELKNSREGLPAREVDVHGRTKTASHARPKLLPVGARKAVSEADLAFDQTLFG